MFIPVFADRTTISTWQLNVSPRKKINRLNQVISKSCFKMTLGVTSSNFSFISGSVTMVPLKAFFFDQELRINK